MSILNSAKAWISLYIDPGDATEMISYLQTVLHQSQWRTPPGPDAARLGGNWLAPLPLYSCRTRKNQQIVFNDRKGMHIWYKTNRAALLVMCSHSGIRVASILCIFNHQAAILGNLETPHSPHQFSAVTSWAKHVNFTDKHISTIYIKNYYLHYLQWQLTVTSSGVQYSED